MYSRLYMACDLSGFLAEFKGKTSKDRQRILTSKTPAELVAIGRCLYTKSKKAKLKASVGISIILDYKNKIASTLDNDVTSDLLHELINEVEWVKRSLIDCRTKNNILRDFGDAAASLKKALLALDDADSTALARKITSLGLSRALRGHQGKGGTSRLRTEVADYIELEVEPKIREWSDRLDQRSSGLDQRSSDSEEEDAVGSSDGADTQGLRDQIDELQDILEIARDDKVIVEERNTALENARALLGKQNRDLSQENQTLREENERLKETIRLFGHQEEFNPFGFDMDESSTATTRYHQFIAFRM